MKKLLCLILALAVVCSIFAIPVSATEAEKLTERTYKDIPFGSAAKSHVFEEYDTTVDGINDPTTALYTEGTRDYIYDYMQSFWYDSSKTVGIDSTDSANYTWNHYPIYYKSSAAFSGSYLSLDENSCWTVPFLEADGETVKNLTYKIDPTKDIVKLVGPLNSSNTKLTEKAKAAYSAKLNELKTATIDIENNSFKNIYILASRGYYETNAIAAANFTAEVYYEGEATPENVQIGIKKANASPSDAPLASVCAILNKISGTTHTNGWQHTGTSYASSSTWYSYEIPCDVTKKVDKITFNLTATNSNVLILSALGEEASVKDLFDKVTTTDVDATSYDSQLVLYNKITEKLTEKEIDLESADADLYATYSTLKANLDAFADENARLEATEKIGKVTYVDVPFGDAAKSKVFVEHGTTITDIDNPAADIYTSGDYDYVYDFLQNIWYNKTMGVDAEDSENYTWSHAPLYYKYTSAASQSYIPLDAASNWTLPFLESDGETVKYLTYNIKPTQKVVQLTGPLSSTYQKMTEKAAALYGDKFKSLSSATINVPKDHYKNIYVLASGGIAQNAALAPENFFAEVYYEGEKNPVLVELGIVKRSISSTDAPLASQTAILNKIFGKAHTSIWSYNSTGGYVGAYPADNAFYSYEIPCDITKVVEKIVLTNKHTARVVTIPSIVAERPSFTDVINMFATTDFTVDNYYSQKNLLSIADDIAEREEINLSVLDNEISNKYALLKSNLADFEVYKTTLDPTATLDVVCYENDLANIYVNLLNPSEIAEKPYSFILSYYDEAGELLDVQVKAMETTENYKESFSVKADEVVEGASSIKVMMWKDFASLKPLAEPVIANVEKARKIAFIGDSITHADLYPFYTESYFVTRFPLQTAEFLNLGKSGGSAANGLNRYDFQIAGNGATSTVIMFGMNDVGRGYYLEDSTATQDTKDFVINQCVTNMETLAGKVAAEGSEVYLMTPSIFDDREGTWTTTANAYGMNEGLGKIGQGFKDIAEAKNYKIIDTHALTLSINERYKDSNEQEMISTDRVHPINRGYYVLAYNVIRNLFPGTGLVAQVNLDASAKSAEAENATVKILNASENGISYTYLAKSLPMAATSYYKAADEKYVPLTDELNREIIKVAGLSDGTYTIKMNGNAVAQYTASQLAEGVNIATLADHPGQLQAMSVHNILQKKHDNTVKIRHVAYVADHFRIYNALEDLEKREQFIATLSPSDYVYDYFVNYDSYAAQVNTWEAENAEYLADARKAAIPETITIEIVKN